LRDVALLVLCAIYYIGILRADLTMWRGRTPTILLALPILLASLRKPPWFVVVVSLLAIAADAADITVEHPLLSLAAGSLVVLVVISYVAFLVAYRRQSAIERDHWRESMIRTVQDLRQPLTVIVGYTQLLRARPDLPDVVTCSLAKIEDATHELKRLIHELLSLEDAPSA
jgi:signal transduction histidine kinase